MNLERWREIDRIFQRVVEGEGEERERLLVELTRGDPGLQAEVAALLRHEPDPISLLDRVGSLAAGASPPLRPGDRLGSWRIGPVLGAGGSSVVFEAERVDRRYERRVAVKVLQHALLTVEALERFRRECQLLARLEHPDIARLEDAGSTDSGLPYIVLERVDGDPIDRWSRRGYPSLDERLALFQRVAGAVAFAHRNLVVHRDLKPSNVLVTAAGEPKLLDFGIARVLSEDRQDWSRLTGTRVPMTPQFASPEQLRGCDVSTASDVYSLGLLLYQLLTGRLPYVLKDQTDDTVWKLVTGALTLQPPSAAARSVPAAVQAGSLKGDLDTIVMAALEIDPERRYPSAQALADEIDRFRRGLPILARAASPGYVIRRFVGRHRLGAAVALAVLLLTIGFAVSMGVTASRLRAQRERATREAATAQEVVAFLGGLFEGAEPAVHQGRDLTARELLDRGADGFERREIDDEATRGALASAIGKAYLELSAFSEARSFLEDSLRWWERAGMPNAQAETRLLLSRLELSESDFERAGEQARAALALLDGREATDTTRAQAQVLLGRALMAVGDLDAGEETLHLALDGLDELGEAGSQQNAALVGLVHYELGGAMMKRGRWQEARPHFDRALELLISAHGELHPYVFETQRLNDFLTSVLEPAETPKEPDFLLELLDRQKQFYGEAHEQMMWTLTDIASAYTVLSQDDLGERYYREALAMQQVLVDDDHLVLAVIHAGLGHIARRRDDLGEAIRHFERSLEISRRRLAADSIDLAFPKMTLGHALARAGRCAEGARLQGEAHEILDRARPPTDFNLVESLWGWGYALACLGEARGDAMMHEALAIADERDWETSDGLRQEVERWRRLTPERPAAKAARD